MGSRLEQKSTLVRKRIEQHSFQDEKGDEYESSTFGGFSDYFRRKKIKLQNLDAELRASSDKPPIFKGVVCHVNGYTQPSLQDIHVLIVQHGGGFIQYLDGKTMVTHVRIRPERRPHLPAPRARSLSASPPAWRSLADGRFLDHCEPAHTQEKGRVPTLPSRKAGLGHRQRPSRQIAVMGCLSRCR